MLVQLHQQKINKSDGFATALIAQREFTAFDDEFRKWLADVQSRHPLADMCEWMLCDESSKYFVKAAA